MRQSRDAVATSSRLCESALPTRSRVTAIRSDDARPWISFRQAPGVFGAGRAISKKKQPRSSGSTRAAASRVDARWRSNARCARTARDTPSVSASSATKAAPPLTSIFSARTSPAGAARAVRAAEQLRRRAPFGGRHEPPEQGVLLQALAAVLLGAGVVERLPDLPVGVGVAQQAVQFAAEVLELGVARLGRRHEGGHDGVLGLPPTCGASRFRPRTGRPSQQSFFKLFCFAAGRLWAWRDYCCCFLGGVAAVSNTDPTAAEKRAGFKLFASLSKSRAFYTVDSQPARAACTLD